MCSVNRTAAGIVAGMLLFADAPAYGADKPVEWRADYDSARKEATAKALPLFLEFHTDDCYHCRRLEAGPLRDSAVSSVLNERYIPLRRGRQQVSAARRGAADPVVPDDDHRIRGRQNHHVP